MVMEATTPLALCVDIALFVAIAKSLGVGKTKPRKAKRKGGRGSKSNFEIR
jgi:hypothetical protein